MRETGRTGENYAAEQKRDLIFILRYDTIRNDIRECLICNALYVANSWCGVRYEH